MLAIKLRSYVIFTPQTNVRSFCILGMFSVIEPKETNSGIPQGTFMRKQKVPKPIKEQGGNHQQEEQFFSPADIAVGASVEFYGRTLVIIDADAYTRAWYKSTFGVEFGPAMECPDDGHREQRLRMEQPLLVRRKDVQERQQDEVRSQPSKNNSSDLLKLPPYQLRDTKVLRFYCAYEDENQLGGRHQCVLYFYVGDQTMEIKETIEPGRHHFPTFLSRQCVLKDSDRLYQCEDLRCGGYIKVYGRHILLLSCDASTAEWYASKGIEQKPLHVAQSESADPTSKIIITPPNGFGTDDDAYALGLKLEPGKLEGKNERQAKNQRGAKVLRFLVHLMRAIPTGKSASKDNNSTGAQRLEEDHSRNLILNFFEFDSTVSIFEPSIPNSGVDGGLFLARGKYKKCISNKATGNTGKSWEGLGGSHSRFLRPEDFLLTAPPVTFEVPATGARLFAVKTVGYDEYTRKILEDIGMILASGGNGEEGDILPYAMVTSQVYFAVPLAVRICLVKQAETFIGAGIPIRALFRAYDEGNIGALVHVEFAKLIRELETQAHATPISHQEVVALLVSFEVATAFAGPMVASGAGVENDESRSKSGIWYDDYVDALSICAPKSVLEQAKEAVCANQLSIEERLFKALADAFMHGESHRAFLRKTLRQLDVRGCGQLDMEQWFHALKVHGLTPLLTESAASTLFLQYDLCGTGKLHYMDLCDAIYTIESEVIPLSSLSSSFKTCRDTCAGKEVSLSRKGQAPTINKYLQDLTSSIQHCDGNQQQQLENAVQKFCSCFSRLGRKRILCKIYTAFDTSPYSKQSNVRRGRITREQFYKGVKETAAEFRVDFKEFDCEVLGLYLFPDPKSCLISYNALLEALCARDLEKLAKVRQDGIEIANRLANDNSFEEKDSSRLRDFGGRLKIVGDAS